MAQNDIFQVAFIVDVAGQPTATICHAKQTSASPTTDEEDDLGQAIDSSSIVSDWMARSSTQATLNAIKISLIHPTSRPGIYRNQGVTGSVGTRVCAAQTSSHHYWACPPFERRNIGRKFWSGLPCENVNRGRLITSALALEQSLADAFENPVSNGGDYEFGVWSELYESFEALGTVKPRIQVAAIRNRRGRPVV